jgi:CheY-like chemotaxis protein
VPPRASGDRFRAVVESCSQVVSLLDREGRVIYVNDSLERSLGRKAEECQGLAFAECLGADGQVFGRLLAACLAGGAPAKPGGAAVSPASEPAASAPVVLEGRDLAGRPRTLEVRLVDRTADADVAAVICFAEDVSDRAPRRPAGEGRSARAGLLPPAVIYELNDPVAAIVTSLELAASRLAATGRTGIPGPVHAAELAEDIRSARQSSERLRQILRDLAAFTEPPASSSVAADAPPPRRARVLVVDDEPTINSAIARTLSPEHDVATVTRAAEALARLRSGERYDVIFCDLMMPQMTGMDLHGELVAELPDQAARMIFLTGGAFTAAARRFLEQVPNARLEKPFDTRLLRKIVSERLE